MLSPTTNILLAGLKPVLLLLFSKAGLATAYFLGQQIGFGSGLLRFCRSANTVPFLLLELRLRLNLRYWVVRVSRLIIIQDDLRRPLLLSGNREMLWFGAGRSILNFFKTLALSDVSPPAVA